MGATKITITLDDAQLAAVRRLVHGRSVSAFVKRAVEVALQDSERWAATLGKALVQTGGPLTAEEKAWAEGVLSSPPKRRGRA